MGVLCQRRISVLVFFFLTVRSILAPCVLELFFVMCGREESSDPRGYSAALSARSLFRTPRDSAKVGACLQIARDNEATRNGGSFLNARCL